MQQAVIVSAVRTGIGSYGGQWSPLSPDKLAAPIIKEAVLRANINPSDIEDVIMGNLYAQHGNIARVSMLEAGLPLESGAFVVDRQCASSLQAINEAALNIMAGYGEVYVACGLEHMTREPWQLDKPSSAFQRLGPSFLDTRNSPDSFGNPRMGITAENVARKFGITRHEMDEFALKSHNKAEIATSNGRFDKQILPLEVNYKKETVMVSKDESIRYGQTIEALQKLRPAFVADNGVVTAGNACPWSDGAAALVITSENKAKREGLEILGYIRSFAVAGVDPQYMGIGPVYAVPKALKRAGLALDDIDWIELNEAFAAQAIPCIRELNLPLEKVNPYGGAIALGHPLGATGAILTTKALYALKENDLHYALITMCVGGGQGAALVIERK